MSLNIDKIVKEQGSKAALDQIESEQKAEVAFEVTSDKHVEVSIQGEKGRLSGAAYVAGVVGLTKSYVAGLRGAWQLRRK